MHVHCAFVLGAGASQMNHRRSLHQPNIYCIAGGMLVGSVSMRWEEKTENRAWSGFGREGWKLKGRDASAISKNKTGRLKATGVGEELPRH